jgi:hypothetical protein
MIYQCYQEICQSGPASGGIARCPQSCGTCSLYNSTRAQDQVLSDGLRRQCRDRIFHLSNAYHYEGEVSELCIDLEFILSQPEG